MPVMDTTIAARPRRQIVERSTSMPATNMNITTAKVASPPRACAAGPSAGNSA